MASRTREFHLAALFWIRLRSLHSPDDRKGFQERAFLQLTEYICAGEGSFSTSGAMPAGVYPLVISAVSGVLSHVSQHTLTVSDFSLAVSPRSGTVQAGGALTYAATITPLAGFDEGVVLYVKGLPSGTFAYFAPPLVSNGSGGSTLHVYTTRWTPPGTYALEVSASNWWLTHMQASTLVVTGP